MIRYADVSKKFRTNGSGYIPVLSNINLEVEDGEFLCLLGPSGCGKTTLLNLAAGFIAPDSGCISIDGVEIKGPGPDRGVVFQDSNLFPWLSVLKNVEYGLKRMKTERKRCRDIAMECLEKTGMADHSDKFPHALSGGMRQRVAIARVMALAPKVMLMDEPFSSLDANTREHLQNHLINDWSGFDRTVIYITHSVDEAAYLADRVIILRDAAMGIHTDICLKRSGPKERISEEFSIIKKELRAALAELPCCISR